MEEVSEEEKRALRGSKFAPLPPPHVTGNSRHPRFAHPGGPMMTNKAAALEKFLERKLHEPNGLAAINPQLLEVAVKNAKETVSSSGTSFSDGNIRHVTAFVDHEIYLNEENVEGSSPGNLELEPKQKKKKKKRRNSKKKKALD